MTKGLSDKIRGGEIRNSPEKKLGGKNRRKFCRFSKLGEENAMDGGSCPFVISV